MQKAKTGLAALLMVLVSLGGVAAVELISAGGAAASGPKTCC